MSLETRSKIPALRHLIIAVLLVAVNLSAPVRAADAASEKSWERFDGKIVHKIVVNGLIRTHLSAVKQLLLTHENQPFSSLDFSHDLQALYNTGDVYDVKGQLDTDDAGGITVTITMKDKWTMFAVFSSQGGGGSTIVGTGLHETNLLGYMVNASAMVWTFNGKTSYDINANQEFYRGTDTMWSLDWQDNTQREVVHYYDGSSAGDLAWRRQQKEIMLGTHFGGYWRLFGYMSVFQDSLAVNDAGFNVKIPDTSLQQRFYPKAIYGRIDHNNFQESGVEIAAQPTVANVIGAGPHYFAFELDYKQVWRVGAKRKDNVALQASMSRMGSGGPNYIYQVGGYYNIRGYSDMREFGRDLAVVNFEWRPYLLSHRWDWSPLDLMVVQGCLFSDFGSAWGDGSLTGQLEAYNFHPLWSAGAGLRVHLVKYAGAILRLDWARTINPDEGIGFSFGIGQFF